MRVLAVPRIEVGLQQFLGRTRALRLRRVEARQAQVQGPDHGERKIVLGERAGDGAKPGMRLRQSRGAAKLLVKMKSSSAAGRGSKPKMVRRRSRTGPRRGPFSSQVTGLIKNYDLMASRILHPRRQRLTNYFLELFLIEYRRLISLEFAELDVAILENINFQPYARPRCCHHSHRI